MYIVINIDNDSVLLGTTELTFYRKDIESDYLIQTDETNATAIIVNGIVYNIEGTEGVGVSDTVKIVSQGQIDFIIEMQKQETKSSAYIDYLSAMTGIDLPDEEEEELEEE